MEEGKKFKNKKIVKPLESTSLPLQLLNRLITILLIQPLLPQNLIHKIIFKFLSQLKNVTARLVVFIAIHKHQSNVIE